MKLRSLGLLSWALPLVLGGTTVRACEVGVPTKAYTSQLAEAPIDGVQKCSKIGDLAALNEMGRRYGLGKGVAKDPQRSFSYYREAATAGYPQAKANLAYMYANGEGTTQDYDQALRLNTEAADAGVGQSQYALGFAYATGLGAKVNAELAEKYFVAAAEQGNFDAQRALVTFYTNGKLVPYDGLKAALWLARARKEMELGRAWRKEDGD